MRVRDVSRCSEGGGLYRSVGGAKLRKMLSCTVAEVMDLVGFMAIFRFERQKNTSFIIKWFLSKV